MNPELDDQQNKDTSSQLPADPTQARPEETYSEPELSDQPNEEQIQPAPRHTIRPTSVSDDNPTKGKTLAIAGLVLAFLPLQLIGLVLSIAAKVKATKGSSVSTLALVGIVLNIVFGLITITIAAAVIISAYNGVHEIMKTSSANADVREKADQLETEITKASAAEAGAAKIAFAYYATQGVYATSAAQLQTVTPLEIVSAEPLMDKPANPSIVEYAVCNKGSAFRIGFWDYIENDISYKLYPEKDAPSEEPECTVVSQILNKS